MLFSGHSCCMLFAFASRPSLWPWCCLSIRDRLHWLAWRRKGRCRRHFGQLSLAAESQRTILNSLQSGFASISRIFRRTSRCSITLWTFRSARQRAREQGESRRALLFCAKQTAKSRRRKFRSDVWPPPFEGPSCRTFDDRARPLRDIALLDANGTVVYTAKKGGEFTKSLEELKGSGLETIFETMKGRGDKDISFQISPRPISQPRPPHSSAFLSQEVERRYGSRPGRRTCRLCRHRITPPSLTAS